uniref:Uncharacterized protein n=1 Tax=Rhizophora mucronata TaxID=61149 RepID=A0A2P2QMH4_RHIMU
MQCKRILTVHSDVQCGTQPLENFPLSFTPAVKSKPAGRSLFNPALPYGIFQFSLEKSSKLHLIVSHTIA